MLLVSGSTRSVSRANGSLGLLVTPSNGNSVASLVKTGLPWAVDNGAFSGFDPLAFRRLLGRCAGQPRLLWIVCPDVVGDARATAERFEEWRAEVAQAGPVAYVGQDGQEDFAPPWERFESFFIGGSTRWKLSAAAAGLAAEARSRGKWLHMGRVNSRRRMTIASDLGCDSIDGSSASRWGDKYLWKYLLWLRQLRQQAVFEWVSEHHGGGTTRDYCAENDSPWRSGERQPPPCE